MLKHFLEFVVCNFLGVFIITQHVIPQMELAQPAFRNVDYLEIFMLTLKMAVPSSYVWLLNFYGFFHAYMNFWGELVCFADRRFYLDWWNANNLGEFWRKWNFPIHSFLMRHCYFPLRRRRVSGASALMTSFFISAVFHEYLMIGVIGKVNGIAFFLMIVNVPAMVLQRYLKDHVSGNTNNILYWLSYLILGQPFGILFSYY